MIEGGAASIDGRLKKGDKIIGVSFDASDNFVDVIEMKLTKVVEMIRGKKGTKVKLKVLVPKEEKRRRIGWPRTTHQNLRIDLHRSKNH